MMQTNRSLPAVALGAGFFFLYAPIVCLIVYSFNESRLLTVWTGFSLKWYVALMHDKELLEAAFLSLRIALMTAFSAVVMGTWGGFVLARLEGSRGFTVYNAMINAPLVMPDVIQGISLLLLFIELGNWLGWPRGRGVMMIWIGHLMLCMSYVSIIVRSRVRMLSRSIEEAALDLGATPTRVFFFITLPQISQTLLAGWLLAFTLSFDDLVLSAFLSGPGSTTLPLVIFSRVRLGINPEVNALATLFIAVVSISVVLVTRAMRSSKAAYSGG